MSFQQHITRPKLFNIVVAKEKKEKCNRSMTANQASQKNRNRFRLRFFWTYLSTSDHMYTISLYPKFMHRFRFT